VRPPPLDAPPLLLLPLDNPPDDLMLGDALPTLLELLLPALLFALLYPACDEPSAETAEVERYEALVAGRASEADPVGEVPVRLAPPP
jgi:hypothetical protein